MLVRFFSHGNTKGDMRTRGGDSAKNYLLGVENAPRDGARLLKGDPSITTEIINGSTYRQVYTSGVLSFAPDERKLTDAQKQEIIESFEQTLFVGLETGQYSGYWVEHSDKGRQELHFVFANIELTTGKALPVYYHKADLQLIDSWKTLTNQQYGLHDPNDPKFKRELPPTHDIFIKSSKLSNLETKTIKETIHQALVDAVADGSINNRTDVVQFLTDAGFEITRQSKDSVSIKNPCGGKNLRFKGAIYHDNFNTEYCESTRDAISSESKTTSRDAGYVRGTRTGDKKITREFNSVQECYQRCLEKRRARHQERYQRPKATSNYSKLVQRQSADNGGLARNKTQANQDKRTNHRNPKTTDGNFGRDITAHKEQTGTSTQRIHPRHTENLQAFRARNTEANRTNFAELSSQSDILSERIGECALHVNRNYGKTYNRSNAGTTLQQNFDTYGNFQPLDMHVHHDTFYSFHQLNQQVTQHERYSEPYIVQLREAIRTFGKKSARTAQTTNDFLAELNQPDNATNSRKNSQRAVERYPSQVNTSNGILSEAHRKLRERFERLEDVYHQHSQRLPRNARETHTGANTTLSDPSRQFSQVLRAGGEYQERIRQHDTSSQRDFRDFTSRARASTTAMASISELSRNYQDTASTVNITMQQLAVHNKQLRDAKSAKRASEAKQAEKERLARLETERQAKAQIELLAHLANKANNGLENYQRGFWLYEQEYYRGFNKLKDPKIKAHHTALTELAKLMISGDTTSNTYTTALAKAEHSKYFSYSIYADNRNQERYFMGLAYRLFDVAKECVQAKKGYSDTIFQPRPHDDELKHLEQEQARLEQREQKRELQRQASKPPTPLPKP